MTAAGPGRRTLSNRQGERTRETVLDAAERLFGQGSFDSVSMRDIAQEAGVLLGAIGYHFKGKEALFRVVATRRAEQINQMRLGRLNDYGEPTVNEIIDAYLRPPLELYERPQWRPYLQLLTQVSREKRWRDLEAEIFLDNTTVFVAALERALPDADRHRLRMAFLNCIAVLLDLLGEGTGRRDLGRPAADAEAEHSIIDSAVDFVTGGLMAVAA